MQKVRYRLSPKMIDAFDQYMINGADELAFNAPELIDYINLGYKMIPGEQEELEKSVSLLKSCVFGLEVDSDQIRKAKALLPKIGNTDVLSKAVFNEIEIYGTVDFMGFGKAIVFSGIKRYQIPSMLHSNNQWLMKGLMGQGLKSFNYIIQSESDIYFETYTPETYDFERLEDKISLFKIFLDEHAHLITNKSVKVFEHESVNYLK